MPLRYLLLLLLTSTLHATPLADGLAAYQRGDYRAALAQWQVLARQGDADAQYNIGLLYAQGRGVPQDYTQAADWYRQAATQGQIEAQFNLGELFFNGRGVMTSRPEALLWWRRAAAARFPPALYNLGVMYLYGYATAIDTQRGLKLVTAAAEAGYPPARAALVRAYGEGLFGLSPDAAQANRWRTPSP